MSDLKNASKLVIAPDPEGPDLTRKVEGIDQRGLPLSSQVVEERPLTLYLNSREIVTNMTIGDYPELLAIGFLFNQGMLESGADLKAVQFDAEVEAVSVHTHSKTRYDDKMERATRTSGCAVGTVFGDMREGLRALPVVAESVRTSWLYSLSHQINQMPSLYLSAGAIHGTVLCEGDQPLVYMEDVGRHNAVDKVAGWMVRENVGGADKLLYTTGRLTSEMVLKSVRMGIPVLVSRSGFTAWGVDLAREYGLTLIGRLRGQRFICLSGAERMVFDASLSGGAGEDRS